MKLRSLSLSLLTGGCAVVLTLVVWVVIVMLLDRPLRGYDHVLWTGSLWLSAIACTVWVSSARWAVRPVLGCTLAFAIFSAVYVVSEGPIFGNVAEGGDPLTTEVVFWNLVYLPLGVFLASDVGAWRGAVRRRRAAGGAQNAK